MPVDKGGSKNKEKPQRKTTSRKRRDPNHIPRPANAFILFRSWYITSKYISTEVETNHRRLSIIIGLTWRNLPEVERQKWFARAKAAKEDHKRLFPGYTFRPKHNQPKTAISEPRNIYKVGPTDKKRCEKIAELLTSSKKGQQLKQEIKEFDKSHVPEIITRFDTPMTAINFGTALDMRKSVSSLFINSPPPAPCKLSGTTPQSITMTGSDLEESPSQDNFIQSPSIFSDALPFTLDSYHSAPVDFSDVDYAVQNPYDFQQVYSPIHLIPGTQFMEDWISYPPLQSTAGNSIPTTPYELYSPFEQVWQSYNPEIYYPISGGDNNYELSTSNTPLNSTSELLDHYEHLGTGDYYIGVPTPSAVETASVLEGFYSSPTSESAHLDKQPTSASSTMYSTEPLEYSVMYNSLY